MWVNIQRITGVAHCANVVWPDLDGRPFARDMHGGRWRVYPWLPGHVVESLPDPAMARQAGRLVGPLHKHLAAFEYIPQGSIPHFHDTDFVLTALQNVHSQLPDEVHGIADDILATLPSLIVADEPQQLIHGDLKISNLIFDDLGHAVGIIDFDTILRHARAIDLGDAFRSWCNRTAEDDPDATFDVAFFEAAASGYAQGFDMPSGPEERARHLRATRQITLELAARFLIEWSTMPILVLTPRTILIVVPTMWRVRAGSITWRRRFPALRPLPGWSSCLFCAIIPGLRVSRLSA